MGKVVRFAVSVEKELFDKFESIIKKGSFANRSQGISNLIKEYLVQNEWLSGRQVAGAITIVYEHTKRELVKKLLSTQHKYHHNIISTQHIHLDHSNCLEVVVVKGNPANIEKLFLELKSTKHIKHIALAVTTTGSKIP